MNPENLYESLENAEGIADLNDSSPEQTKRVAMQAGRAVTRSAPRPEKVPGATLSPEASRQLQEELADIRRAERDGIIGADNYYIGVQDQP